MADDTVLDFAQFAGRPPAPSFSHTIVAGLPDGAPKMVSRGRLTTPTGTSYARCESPCTDAETLDAQGLRHEAYLLDQMTRER